MPNPHALTIERAELRIVRLPLLTPFTIATGTMTEKLFPLLILHADGVEGVAEGVMDPLPDYLEETLPAALALLREVLLPGLVGRALTAPQDIAAGMEGWRGHRMTRAMVEMAAWDLWARSLNVPLKALLGGTREAVEVGVSLGIGDIPGTVERVDAHLAQGYRRIKLKIMPGHDLAVLDAVRAAFPDAHLTVDANASYRLADAAHLARLDRYGLDYIEQPLAFDDMVDHAALQARMATPICLDESLRSAADTRRALVMGAARVVNIKVGRVGGHLEARRIHDLCAAFDVPVWCGGMLESGIGRAHNLHLSSLPGFTRPGDTSSSSRYFARDIVAEQIEAADGIMPVPPGPGTGVTLDRAFLDSVTASREVFGA